MNMTSYIDRPRAVIKDMKNLMESAEHEHPLIPCAIIGFLSAIITMLLLVLMKKCFFLICRRYRRNNRKRRVPRLLNYDGLLTPDPNKKQRSLRINSLAKKQPNANVKECGYHKMDFDVDSSSGHTSATANKPSASTNKNPFEGDSAQSGTEDEEIILA